MKLFFLYFTFNFHPCSREWVYMKTNFPCQENNWIITGHLNLACGNINIMKHRWSSILLSLERWPYFYSVFEALHQNGQPEKAAENVLVNFNFKWITVDILLHFVLFSVGVPALHGRSTVLGFDERVPVKLHGFVIHCSSSSQMQQQNHRTVLPFRHHTPIHRSVQHLQEICRSILISVIVNSILVFNTFTNNMADVTWSEYPAMLSYCEWVSVSSAIFDSENRGGLGWLVLWQGTRTKLSTVRPQKRLYFRLWSETVCSKHD